MPNDRLKLAVRAGQPVLPFTTESWFNAVCGGPGPKLVWLCMCYAARPRKDSVGGNCWASVSTLQRLGEWKSIRTVREHLRTLALGGRIEAESVSRGGRPTFYRLNPAKSAGLNPAKSAGLNPAKSAGYVRTSDATASEDARGSGAVAAPAAVPEKVARKRAYSPARRSAPLFSPDGGPVTYPSDGPRPYPGVPDAEKTARYLERLRAIRRQKGTG